MELEAGEPPAQPWRRRGTHPHAHPGVHHGLVSVVVDLCHPTGRPRAELRLGVRLRG
jgi:hypothetical protein